ncbi:MAG: hypothetical protein P1V20_05190 [Verrucomicrobiales bacterium]|nr:hypothetical protein [Verrucomicrobiales bacterium]
MNTDDQKPTGEGWFDKAENVQKVLRFLFGACALMVIIDVVFWATGFDKHPYFKWEQWPGFYAIYGFVACVVLVLIAKYILRPLVMKSENYYDNREKGGDDV